MHKRNAQWCSQSLLPGVNDFKNFVSKIKINKQIGIGSL